jgi:hypothetical protein
MDERSAKGSGGGAGMSGSDRCGYLNQYPAHLFAPRTSSDLGPDVQGDFGHLDRDPSQVIRRGSLARFLGRPSRRGSTEKRTSGLRKRS